jgi:glycosyltransferase involved in cell wall biosynthesis
VLSTNLRQHAGLAVGRDGCLSFALIHTSRKVVEDAHVDRDSPAPTPTVAAQLPRCVVDHRALYLSDHVPVPTITVVIPVFNRDAELRRALRSLQEQTFTDFECIVVDDASTIPIGRIVDSFADDRFICARNLQNGGPYNARVQGYRLMRGEFLVGLDSDEEAYPWMLGQAVKYLREVPEVDGVAGMHLRMSDGRLFVRVRHRTKIMHPSEYALLPRIPDCIGAVRRVVVDEWLQKRDDYFALELHQWFTFHMNHSMLFVEEPWTRHHADAAERVSQVRDTRRYDDYVKFLDEHLAYVDGVKSVVLDQVLEDGWFHLWRARRKEEAARFEHFMAKRGLSKRRAVARRAFTKARRHLPFAGTPVSYIE